MADQITPASTLTPIHHIKFSLNICKAIIEIAVQTNAVQSTSGGCGTITALPKKRHKLKMTPTTAAVAYCKTDFMAGLVCVRSINGAPAKMNRKEGKNV